MKVIKKRDVVHNENTVYYFKKEYTVETLKKSIINVYAEARYKLYINKELVAVGPCKASSEVKYYDELDITKYLKEGKNVFEVAVLQLANEPFSKNYMFMESVQRGGDMCLAIWGNIGEQEISTDEDWLVAKELGMKFFFKPEYEAYNVAALCEDVSLKYKKNEYENAVAVGGLYDLDDEKSEGTEVINPVCKRPIPMMYFEKKDFIGSKNDIFDAGELTCGYIRIKFSGKGKVKLTYAECMVFKEDGQILKRNRTDENGTIIGDYDIVEVSGECMFEPYWMRTFRYVKADIDGDVTIESIDYLETGYPIEIADGYDFGNQVDNELFRISTNTLKRCMHESYVDCPYYEQLQYTMDTHLQMLFTYQLTQDKKLAEKAIDDFAKSYRVGGLTQSRYPVNKAQYIPGFSLYFIMMLYEHLKRFDDKEFIKKYLPVADGIADWFKKRLDGYMVPKSNLWDFIDWAYEYDKETGRILSDEPIAVYSLMLAYTLEILSEMHDNLGSGVDEYKLLAEKIKEDVKERCFDEEKGLYADSPEKAHFAQHPQIWAVLCGVEKGEDAKKLLMNSMSLTCKATYAYMFYLFRAFEKAGIYEMTEEYINELRELVDLGCTTTPERMGEDVRSECHAWSAVAIYEFTAKVLGVTYRENKLFIEPYIKGRKSAKGKVATPYGMVYVEWEIVDDGFMISIDIGENTEAILTMPDKSVITAKGGKYTCKIA